MKLLLALLLTGCAALPSGYHWTPAESCPGKMEEHWIVGNPFDCAHYAAEACVERLYGPQVGDPLVRCRVIALHDLRTSKGLETREFGVSVYDHELKHWEGWDHL